MKRKIAIDQLGMCASTLCIIHCIALPIFLVLGVESILKWLELEALELILICFSFAIGMFSAIGGYIRHKQHFVPVLFGAGILLLLNGESVDHALTSLVLSIAGALVIIYAHVQNMKWKRREFVR